MKTLIFHIGSDPYGLRLDAIERVLPLLELKRLPLAPCAVAGLMDYQGAPVPVIDLAVLAGLAPSQDYFDTRILLVEYAAPDGARHRLGLLAEQVRGIRELAPEALRASGVRAAPFLGPVSSAADGMVQLVELEHMLPAALRAALFQPREATP